MHLDEASEEIGVWGFFPMGLFFLYNLIIPTIQPWIILSNQFVLRAPEKFTCDVRIPANFSEDEECKRCASMDNKTVIYEDPNLEGTLVPKWGLICDRKALIPLSTSMYFVGVFFASFVTGPLVDKFGRKRFMLGCQWAMSVFSIILPFVPNFALFTLVRTFIGFFAFSCLMPLYIYSCEIVPASYRVLTSSLSQFFWGLGTMALPLIAYFCQNDPQLLLILIALPGFLTIPLTFITPESPVWSITNGHRESVENLYCKLAKKRGVDMSKFQPGFLIAEEKQIIESKPKVKQNFTAHFVTWKEIFSSWMLAKHQMIMMVVWMVSAMFFYGLSYSSTSLSGSPYLNLFYSGLAELLSYSAMIPILKFCGRRLPTMSFHCGAGLALILVPVARALSAPTGLIIFLNMVGKFCITFTFATAWLYSGELAPTSCRTTFFSVCECASRLGSFAAPYTLLLAKATHTSVPEIIYGVTSLIAGVLIFFLPETNGYPMPACKEDLKRMYKKLPPLKEQDAEPLGKINDNQSKAAVA